MIIHKKSIRDIWELKWQSLSIILVVACGVALYAGFDMGLKSLFYTREKICSDLNSADLELLFIPTDKDTIPDFSDLDGIEKVERRLLFPGTIILERGKRLSGIFILLESLTPEINSFKIVDGRNIDNEELYSVAIERSLAKHHMFKPGDNIKIKVGEKIYKSKISSIIVSPEFLTGVSNPDFFAPGKGTLGVIYGNIMRTKKSLGFTLINDLVFKFSKEADPVQLKNRILEKMHNFNLEKIIQQKDQFSYKYLQLDLDAFKIYIPAIILIMVVLSFVTTFVIYNRFIISQRKEIGTLLCLGYRRKEIRKSILMGATLLGIIDVILGLAISLIVRNIFVYSQYLALDLPVYYTKIFAVSILKAAIMGIIIAVIPPLLLLSQLFKSSPHEIIREPIKEIEVKRNPVFAFLGKHSFLSLEFRYTIRNIVRKKWLTVSTIACIGLSLGVAISYITSVTSISKTFIHRFGYEQWDLCADFLFPVYLDDLKLIKEIPGIRRFEPYIRKFVEVSANKISKDSNLLGIIPRSKIKRIKMIAGNQLSRGNKEEIIVNQDIAKALKISVGDSVEVKVNQKRFKLKLVGICSEITVGQSVVPIELAQKMFEIPDETTGIFVDINNQSNLETVKKSLDKFEYVGRVTEKNNLLKDFLNLMHEFMRIVNIATISSIFVAIIFIYTNINLMTFERKGEFALLKSLGYPGKSIQKIILSHVLIIGSLGGIFSIPIAIFTAVFLNYRYSEAWYIIENYFIVPDFIWIILIALVLMPFMAIPVIKYIQNFEISEILHQKCIE